MYYDFIQTHRKRFIIIVTTLFILFSVWATIDAISHIGKIPVVVSLVPNDATISLSDKKIGSGTQWITPGTYTLTVSKNGFQTLKDSVIVTDKKQQNVIAASLVPQTKEAKEWAVKHEKDYKRNEEYGAIQASSNGAYFSDSNPITKQLPFIDPYFKIGYTRNNDQTITLTINTPSPRYRFYAVEKIRQMGYDPTDFVIVFKDFRNPLETK